MFLISAGVTELIGGAYVGGASSDGIELSGGTLRAQGVRIDTSANSSHNPITKSGGTLRLAHCTLVAEGTRDSISAPTAQDVSSYGTYANKAVDADVTELITGGFIVDAQVA